MTRADRSLPARELCFGERDDRLLERAEPLFVRIGDATQVMEITGAARRAGAATSSGDALQILQGMGEGLGHLGMMARAEGRQ